MNRLFLIDVIDKRNELLKKMLEFNNYECVDYNSKENLNSENITYIMSPKSNILSNDIVAGSYTTDLFHFNLDKKLSHDLSKKGINLINVMNIKNFRVTNSKYTAEGALKYIIENTKISISDMNILILGYGYLAKALIEYLTIFKPIIDIKTFDKDEVEKAIRIGLNAKLISQQDSLLRYDLIINTIPKRIYNMSVFKENALVLELASGEGAFNYSNINAKYVLAKGVPSTLMEKSSALLLHKTILDFYS